MSTERSACVPPKRLLMPLICRSAVTPKTPRSLARLLLCHVEQRLMQAFTRVATYLGAAEGQVHE
jgi:hypothetical protein